MQKELDLDSSSKPKVKLSDLSEHDCPCPQDYLDVSVELLLYNCMQINFTDLLYLQLIHRCWAFLPAFRPTFEQIKKSLYGMNPIRESPVDNMMKMVSG